jgi:hypothetical protein
MDKVHACTTTDELYIINMVMEDLSTLMVGWENSEFSARKAVENLDKFYPCGKPKYVVIEKAHKKSIPLIQGWIWYRRVNKKYKEFENYDARGNPNDNEYGRH